MKRTVFFASQNGRCGPAAASAVGTGAGVGEENAQVVDYLLVVVGLVFQEQECPGEENLCSGRDEEQLEGCQQEVCPGELWQLSIYN